MRPSRCVVARAAMGLGESIKYAVKRYPTVFLQNTKARCVASRRCALHAPKECNPSAAAAQQRPALTRRRADAVPLGLHPGDHHHRHAHRAAPLARAAARPDVSDAPHLHSRERAGRRAPSGRALAAATLRTRGRATAAAAWWRVAAAPDAASTMRVNDAAALRRRGRVVSPPGAAPLLRPLRPCCRAAHRTALRVWRALVSGSLPSFGAGTGAVAFPAPRPVRGVWHACRFICSRLARSRRRWPRGGAAAAQAVRSAPPKHRKRSTAPSPLRLAAPARVAAAAPPAAAPHPPRTPTRRVPASANERIGPLQRRSRHRCAPVRRRGRCSALAGVQVPHRGCAAGRI